MKYPTYYTDPTRINKQTDFKANTNEQNLQSLIQYLPSGKLYEAKNIEDSNLRNYLLGFCPQITAADEKFIELLDQYNLWSTTELIEEFESFLGIPDDCFAPDDETPLDYRRAYAIAKLARMNLTNREDFIKLANFLGFDISIESAKNYAVFPFTFPVLLTDDNAYFVVIVRFLDINRPSNVFPLTFPITFDTNDRTAFLECVFDMLKPINVKIIYKYADDL